MQSGNSYSTPVTVLVVLGFVCLAVKWISDNFGVNTTGYVLLGLGIAGAVVLGFALNMANSKSILHYIAQFNRDDAQTDRYRQQSFKALASGEAAERKANAQMQVLDARRIDQLANQRAKLLTDVERQKWHLQQQNRAFADAQPDDAGDDWWTTDPNEASNDW